MPPLLLPAVGKKLLKNLFPQTALKKSNKKASVAESATPYQPKLNQDFPMNNFCQV